MVPFSMEAVDVGFKKGFYTVGVIGYFFFFKLVAWVIRFWCGRVNGDKRCGLF